MLYEMRLQWISLLLQCQCQWKTLFYIIIIDIDVRREHFRDSDYKSFNSSECNRSFVLFILIVPVDVVVSGIIN